MVLRRVREVVTLIVLTFMLAGLGNAAPVPAVSPAASAAEPRMWPCRIIVQRPLLQVVEAAWDGSKTFRRLCGALARKRAIAILLPGAETSQFAAQTRLSVTEDGIAVGRVMVPLSTETLQCIAHEFEHLLEFAEGLNLSLEAERKGSGVWRTVSGFETQRAIDTGRQVAREVAEGRRSSAPSSSPRSRAIQSDHLDVHRLGEIAIVDGVEDTHPFFTRRQS